MPFLNPLKKTSTVCLQYPFYNIPLHLLAAGHYMFVEASSPAAKGMKANLCSKEFKGLTKTTLSFKYHALVSKGSFLRVVLSNTLGKTVLWQLTDKSIDQWSEASVSIDSKTNYKVRWRASQCSSAGSSLYWTLLCVFLSALFSLVYA